MSEVLVYGAGMSGLVAAYNLAKDGYEVTVRERERSWGGSRTFNPSTHTTPLDLAATSEYIGVDISPAFVPARSINLYIGEFKLPVPTPGGYHVERSDRPTSLDALLYAKCVEAGVRFEFGEELRKEDLDSLPPGTVIACGLNEEAYRHLEVPCMVWHAWQSRGPTDRDGDAWIWMDECISEYGYCSMLNGIYFNLLPDYGQEVSRQSLERYREFIERREGFSCEEWEYVRGVVPTASPDNPQLFRDKFIMCGTISGAFDPLLGFGISGALVSGKVAATAVSDRERALAEFERFTRNFARVFAFKQEVWRPVTSEVKALEKVLAALGAKRAFSLMMEGIKRSIGKTAIPGFSPLSCN